MMCARHSRHHVARMRGRVANILGVTYSVRNGYDTESRRTSLMTLHNAGSGGQHPSSDIASQCSLRSGDISSVAAGDTTTWACNLATSLCTAKTYADGSTVTYTIERTFDAYGRLVRNSLCGSVSPCETTYTPDGRIDAISNGEAVVEYAYTPDRFDAGYTLTLTNGTSFTRTLVRDPYRRNLILSITNSVNDVPVDVHAFTYDAANRLKTASTNGVLILTNYYDAKSRRIKNVTPHLNGVLCSS